MTAIEGQAALRSPIRAPRQLIHVQTPCATCAHSGLCAIEEQIEENLVLELIQIGRPVQIVLSCSEFQPAGHDMAARITWTTTRRARFEATIAEKRRLRAAGS